MDLDASQDIVFSLSAKKGKLIYAKKQDSYSFRLKKVSQISWFSSIDAKAGSLTRKSFLDSWSRLVNRRSGLSFMMESGKRQPGKPSADLIRLSLPERKGGGLIFEASLSNKASQKQINQTVRSLANVHNPRLQFAGTLSMLIYRKNIRTRNFKDRDLRGTDLTGVTFQNSNFKKSNLSGVTAISSDLSGSRFNSASMNQIDLTASDLSKSVFSEATATDALLDGVNAVRSDFSYTNLAGSSLVGADLNGSNFTAANMTGVTAIGANFAGADLRGADLSGSNVRFANFQNANLNNVVFADVDFGGAVFEGASFVGATCFDRDKLVNHTCPFG